MLSEILVMLKNVGFLCIIDTFLTNVAIIWNLSRSILQFSRQKEWTLLDKTRPLVMTHTNKNSIKRGRAKNKTNVTLQRSHGKSMDIISDRVLFYWPFTNFELKGVKWQLNINILRMVTHIHKVSEMGLYFTIMLEREDSREDSV